MGDKSIPDILGNTFLIGLYKGSQISSTRLNSGWLLYVVNQLPITPIITAYHKISKTSFIAKPNPAINRALMLYSKPLKLGLI